MERADNAMTVGAIPTVILCGGMGTRLREETEYRPKPLVEVGGRPILWHIMRTYEHYGFRDFILCLGYRGNMIKQYFLDYQAMAGDLAVDLGRAGRGRPLDCDPLSACRVILSDTGADTMTGGRLGRVSRHIAGDIFMVTYGDGLADIDIADLVAFHRAHGRMATVTTVRPRSRFGLLELDDEGQVTRFVEKPQLDGWISAGYFVFDRTVLDLLDGDECVLERDPLERLAREGQLAAYRHCGSFFAMDTYREYLELNALWQRGEAFWRVGGSDGRE